MRLFSVLFLLYVLLELWLLILAGGAVGAGVVVLWVIASAILGLVLLRRQGLSTLRRANERMQGGELPGREMLEGGLLALGAALLVAPGLLGDAIGLCLVLPPLRHVLVSRLVGRPLPGGLGRRMRRGPGAGQGPVTIEGDYSIDGDRERPGADSRIERDVTPRKDSPPHP